MRDAAIAPAPECVLAALRRAPRPVAAAAPAGLAPDHPAAVAVALDWLLRVAPVARKGHRGMAVYQAAARLHEWGLSRETALDLIADHYAPRFDPPLGAAEIETSTANGIHYAQNPGGSLGPAALFSDMSELAVSLAADAPAAAVKKPLFAPLDMTYREEDIPPRPWLIPGMLMHGAFTALLAPPGVGKSLFELALAAAIALGDPGLLGYATKRPTNVLLVNNEDDVAEQQLRLAALCREHGIERSKLQGRLHTYTAAPNSFLMATVGDKGNLVRTKGYVAMVDYVTRNDIKCVALDPLSEMHDGEENSNRDIIRVTTLIKALMAETGCAVLLVHHTRKQAALAGPRKPGDPDMGAGAGALIRAARIVYSLLPMSEDEAAALGVSDEQRHSYMRLDGAKGNYSKKAATVWLEKRTVSCLNGETTAVPRIADFRAAIDAQHDDVAAIVAAAVIAADGELSVAKCGEELAASRTYAEWPAKRRQEIVMTVFAAPREIDGAAFELCEVPGERGVKRFVRVIK